MRICRFYRTRKNRTTAVGLVFLLLGPVFLLADTLDVADTAGVAVEVPFWPDSLMAQSDTLPENASSRERWFMPFGFLIISAAAAVGLFTIRSK